MNVDRIRALAKHLRRRGIAQHFDMGDYFSGRGDQPMGEEIHTCGTVACIAGHAVALLEPNSPRWDLENSIHRKAQKLLGLTEYQGDQLFSPCDAGPFEFITAGRASKVLDRLADTGKVQWT